MSRMLPVAQTTAPRVADAAPPLRPRPPGLVPGADERDRPGLLDGGEHVVLRERDIREDRFSAEVLRVESIFRAGLHDVSDEIVRVIRDRFSARRSARDDDDARSERRERAPRARNFDAVWKVRETAGERR